MHIGLGIWLSACAGDKGQAGADTGDPGHTGDTSDTHDSGDTDSGDTDSGDSGDSGEEPGLLRTVTGFSTPESVRCSDGTCYVSNISGSPSAEDGDGFISTMTLDGELVALDAFPDVTLNAPKGSAIVDGVLYVTDITEIRAIPLHGGAASSSGALDGAEFLNDLVAGPDGDLYASDSSAGVVYRWDRAGAAEIVVRSGVVSSPNGLAIFEDTLYVLSGARAGAIASFDLDGGPDRRWSLPAGQLDGLEIDEDGLFYITSWETATVYVGTPDDGVAPLQTDLTSPADLGYDASARRLYVPLFQEDAVAVVALGR